MKTERGDGGQGICPVGSWGHASWAERAAGTRGLEPGVCLLCSRTARRQDDWHTACPGGAVRHQTGGWGVALMGVS